MLFFRVGFLFQAAFWVVLVSFALTGGNYKEARHAHGFAAPARQTASYVVETVMSLRTICDDHGAFCRQVRSSGGGIGHWTTIIAEQFAGVWDWSSSRLKQIARKD